MFGMFMSIKKKNFIGKILFTEIAGENTCAELRISFGSNKLKVENAVITEKNIVLIYFICRAIVCSAR